MNRFFNQDFSNKINLYKNNNLHYQPSRNNYKLIKEYYKSKTNLDNYIKNQITNFSENFELLEYINSGSSGVVYEGRYRKNPEKHVCLKFLLNKLEEEKREKKNKNININSNCNNNTCSKIREINIQNKLKDKNITQYYDYCDLNNYGCIIMEFAKYGDLENFQKNLIKKKCLSETLLAYITKQILDGLLYIHQSKIIHMDIKQQNILIDENFNIKITDFSVSLPYDNYKENDKISLPLSGTSLYMSPEVLSRSQIDYEDCSKIDMYSLGVVLFNLAFEKFPYELDYSYKRNFNLIFEKIKSEKFKIPEKKNFSPLFKKFLENLLEKDIKNRMSIYDALEDPWIKAADLIFKEKEKLNNFEKFLINMITNNIRSFNEYLKNNNSDTFHTSN